jgi:hypothetical protein
MTHKLKVALLRGPEFYWRKACELTRDKQGFTAADLAGCTSGVANATVRRWLSAMRRQGEIKVIGAGRIVCGHVENIWAVVRIRDNAPAVERAGNLGMKGRAQQQMWNAMRILPNFTIKELAVAASIEERPVTLHLANWYVVLLARAGMVGLVEKPLFATRGCTPDVPGRWRLLRQHNSGPAAPQIFQARFVFDPNRDQIVGESEVLS